MSSVIQAKGFKLRCDSDLTVQAQWLQRAIEATIEVRDGASIQIGWSLFFLQRIADELWVCEPDFDANPFRDVRPDVSASLRVLAQQVQFMKQLGCESNALRFDDKVILHKSTWSADKFYGQRQALRDGDSGWYFGPMGLSSSPGPEDLEARYVYQLMFELPSVMPVLCLPAAYLVIFEGRQSKTVVNQDNQVVWTA